jgi:hypothetical protein
MLLGNKFLKNLLTGVIDSPSLLALVAFKVPLRSNRSNAMFHISFSSTNYMQNEPLRRFMSQANTDPTFNFLVF